MRGHTHTHARARAFGEALRVDLVSSGLVHRHKSGSDRSWGHGPHNPKWTRRRPRAAGQSPWGRVIGWGLEANGKRGVMEGKENGLKGNESVKIDSEISQFIHKNEQRPWLESKCV